MKINLIEIKNFLVHEHSLIEFSDGINIITGENGSGKSSIVQAIFYALFGQALYYKNKNELIRFGKRDFEIVLKLDEFTIRRDTKNVIAIGNNIGSISKSEDLKRLLYRKYNINPQRYLSTLLIKQKSIDEFINLSPRNRFIEFERIIGIDILKKISERTEEFIKNYKRQLEEYKLDELEKELEDIEIKISQKEKEKELSKEELEELEREINEIKNYIRKIENLEELLRKFNEIQEKENKLIEINNYLNLNKEKYEKYELFNKFYDKAKDIKLSYDKMKEYEKELKDIEVLKEKYEIYERYSNLLKDEKIIKLESDFNLGSKLGAEIEKIFKTRDINKLINLIEELKDKEIKIEEEIEQKNLRLGEIKNDLEKIEKTINEIKNAKGICPLCKQPLTDEHKNQVLEQSIKDKEKLQKEKENLLKSIDELKKEKNQVSEKLKNKDKVYDYVILKKNFDMNLWKEWSKIKNEVKKNEKDYKNAYERYLKKEFLEKEISKIKDLINSWNFDYSYDDVISFIEENQNFYNEYRLKLKEKQNLESEIKEKDKIKNDIELLKNELKINELNITIIKTLKEQKSSKLNSKLTRIGELREKIKNCDNEIERLNQEQNKVKEKISKYNSLKDKKNFFEDLNDKLIKLINYERSRYSETLRILTENYFEKFSLNDYKQIEFKIENEQIEILVYDNSGYKREASALSGGERTSLSLALRLAIAQLLDIRFKLIILDEPTDGMDNIRLESLKELFLEFKRKNPDYQMIIITHEEDLSEIADNKIILERKNNRSFVRKFI